MDITFNLLTMTSNEIELALVSIFQPHLSRNCTARFVCHPIVKFVYTSRKPLILVIIHQNNSRLSNTQLCWHIWPLRSTKLPQLDWLCFRFTTVFSNQPFDEIRLHRKRHVYTCPKSKGHFNSNSNGLTCDSCWISVWFSIILLIFQIELVMRFQKSLFQRDVPLVTQ